MPTSRPGPAGPVRLCTTGAAEGSCPRPARRLSSRLSGALPLLFFLNNLRSSAMAIVRFVFAALRPGVDAADYERFEREADYAVSEKIKTIVSYRTHRITETGAGLSGGPWDYVERIEVT